MKNKAKKKSINKVRHNKQSRKFSPSRDSGFVPQWSRHLVVMCTTSNGRATS